MSRFGQEQLQDFDALYVPHAVDCSQFAPQPQARMREALGIDPDAFVVGHVGANKGRPSRKCIQETLQAFRIFSQRHENAILYLHTIMDPNHAGGEAIGDMMVSLDLPEGSVLIADQYRQMFNPQPPRNMAAIYSTFDVLLERQRRRGLRDPDHGGPGLRHPDHRHRLLGDEGSRLRLEGGLPTAVDGAEVLAGGAAGRGHRRRARGVLRPF